MHLLLKRIEEREKRKMDQNQAKPAGGMTDEERAFFENQAEKNLRQQRIRDRLEEVQKKLEQGIGEAAARLRGEERAAGCGGCQSREPAFSFEELREVQAHELAMMEASRVHSWAEALVAIGEMIRAELDERRQHQLEIAARYAENIRALVDGFYKIVIASVEGESKEA